MQTVGWGILLTAGVTVTSTTNLPASVTSACSINPLDPFGKVARTCWRCLHCHPSLADMLSATAHHLFGTRYHYPSDLSTVSTRSNLI